MTGTVVSMAGGSDGDSLICGGFKGIPVCLRATRRMKSLSRSSSLPNKNGAGCVVSEDTGLWLGTGFVLSNCYGETPNEILTSFADGANGILQESESADINVRTADLE
jgi:hypothetical protein